MAKRIQNYNLMIAHSGDTTEFVDIIKMAVDRFCSEHNKYNNNAISFDVRDFNDATFATYSQAKTQDVVFEQFAGHADIVIALIGRKLGEGLRAELESFISEDKQIFLYLYDGGFRVYSRWETYEEDVKRDASNAGDIIKKTKDKGYTKIFVTKEELTKYIVDDLARFIVHRRKIRFELLDKSYARFAYDEVDRYRKEILSLERIVTKGIAEDSSKDIADDSSKDIAEGASKGIAEDASKGRMIEWIKEHSLTNILELMRLLRSMLAEEYDLDYTDITVSFVWGYHNPKKSSNEKLIRLSSRNIISLNHSGTPAKLIELLERPESLLRYMLKTSVSYKWYQYKSYACQKDRYWWPNYEISEKTRCQEWHSGDCQNPTCERCKKRIDSSIANDNKNEKTPEKNNKESGDTPEKNIDKQFGGSIFCYRIVLNGDAASTNNYVLGYIMVSTYQKPFTNTVHDSIREEVKESIKNMVNYRIKPQLLVELSQLYIAYLYSGCKDEGENEDYVNAWKKIEKSYDDGLKKEDH